MARLVKKWLPHTRIRHPWTEERFVVMTRAQCVSSARWDLCGGHRVTGVPTATGATSSAIGNVIVKDRLGGLLKFYRRKAA